MNFNNNRQTTKENKKKDIGKKDTLYESINISNEKTNHSNYASTTSTNHNNISQLVNNKKQLKRCKRSLTHKHTEDNSTHTVKANIIRIPDAHLEGIVIYNIFIQYNYSGHQNFNNSKPNKKENKSQKNTIDTTKEKEIKNNKGNTKIDLLKGQYKELCNIRKITMNLHIRTTQVNHSPNHINNKA